MKPIGFAIAICALAVAAYGQQAQPSVKRHPGDVLHYQVKFEGGELAKVTVVNLNFRTSDPIPADQQGLTNGFGGPCVKSVAVGVWDCSVTIPDRVWNGNYRVNGVGVGAGTSLGKYYEEDLHVPLVPIENSAMFIPPTKVTVTPKP
jgi:hypothetical protein